MTIHQGSAQKRDVVVDADVVIIGSGAGGAVAAALLASTGKRVVIVEEGPYCPVEEYKEMRPSQHLRKVWRDGGMSVAVGVGQSPTINVTMGRCVGGSSMLTGGVCFRTPDHVLNTWQGAMGLAELSPEGLRPAFEDVERSIHVEEVPISMRSRSTQLFAEGARARGFELKPLRRNTKDCNGCGRCNFGCPHGAKMSVDITYLPRALAAGAELFSDALVSEVIVKNGRAIGVQGRFQSPHGEGWFRARRPRFKVHAKCVIVAAGSYHSPLLLMRSDLTKRGGPVGRNMTLHPAFRMFARFDEEVRGWNGALQSAYSDAFEKDGITLVGLFVPPGVLAATMTGFGPEHVARAQHIKNIAVFGGMIHDEGGGQVRRGPGREPLVTYRMAPKDRQTIPKVLRTMAETFFAAGAKEVFPPILGHAAVDADQFRKLDLEAIPVGQLECSSQHPLGTCRMGIDPGTSVVDPDGKVWGCDGLFVADGSVVPTSLGVNPQLTVMAMATRIAWKIAESKLW